MCPARQRSASVASSAWWWVQLLQQQLTVEIKVQGGSMGWEDRAGCTDFFTAWTCRSARCTFLYKNLRLQSQTMSFSQHKRKRIRCSCFCWLVKVIFTPQDWDTKLPLGCWMTEEACLVSPSVLEGPLLSVPCCSSPWFRLQKGQNSGTLVFKESCRFMVCCCSSPHNMLLQLCAHAENDGATLGWGQLFVFGMGSAS